MNSGLCLQYAVGRTEDCPGERWPFWEACARDSEACEPPDGRLAPLEALATPEPVAVPAICDTGNWAASSVTDGYGCLWAMPSVCVADAAVFPTSGAHKPTLTIMATTWRNARAWAGVEGPPALPPPAPVGTDDGAPWELLAGAGAVAVAGAAAGAYAVARSRRRAGEPREESGGA